MTGAIHDIIEEERKKRKHMDRHKRETKQILSDLFAGASGRETARKTSKVIRYLEKKYSHDEYEVFKKKIFNKELSLNKLYEQIFLKDSIALYVKIPQDLSQKLGIVVVEGKKEGMTKSEVVSKLLNDSITQIFGEID